MFPASFDYHRAGSLAEALDLLGRLPDAKLLAGGHSLLPMMKLRLAQPAALIDIGRLTELVGIEARGDRVRIGALTPHAEVARSEVLKRDCPLLAEAAGEIGDPAVRNKGTVGGNIAHADPASDLPGVLVALEATVHVAGPDGERSIAAADFFLDLLYTDLRPGEILTAVEVPRLAPRPGMGSAYLKVEHPASGYALCGAAAVVGIAPPNELTGGQVTHARLAFNGIANTPVDVSAALSDLISTAGDDAMIDALMPAAIQVEDPLGDLHASGEYRVQLARVYGARALKAARDRARAGAE